MLRAYQQHALDQIRSLFARGTKKVMLHLATGGGKTVVFCVILKSSYEKGKKAIMVVKGRKLVAQASARLDREGVPHGVMMAGHWRNQPNQPIQVCSIDTLVSRGLVPEADIVVIDEAHLAATPSYHWLTEAYPNAFFLPVTATPYCKKSLRHIADEIVRPIRIKELIEQGFLVPPKYYAPSIPDLTGVRTTSGDFNAEDLDKVLNENHPIGDIVSNWVALADSRPTILFAVSIRHSLNIVSRFKSCGIPAEHVDADCDDKTRENAIKRLERGEIKVLSNVGILCTGVDIPKASCIVMARPTKSYSLYIQQAGRGTRIDPSKKDFLIIDHGGNVLRHGLITEDREGSLDPMPKKSRSNATEIKTCETCYAIYSVNESSCPLCGDENKVVRISSKEEKAANPIIAGIEVPDEFHLKVISIRGELIDIQKRKGYHRGWVWHRLKEKFGEEVANKYFKHSAVRSAPEKFRFAKIR